MMKLSPDGLRLLAWLLLCASLVFALFILYLFRVSVYSDDFIGGTAKHYFEFERGSRLWALAVVCFGALAWFLLIRQANKKGKPRTGQ